MNEYADPSTFDGTRRPLRLLEYAEQHVSLFGEEDFDLADWEVDVDDPVELAEILEELEELKRWIRLIDGRTRELLRGLLGGAAIRVGDAVYVEGRGSGTWKPTGTLWRWLATIEVDDPDWPDELARYLEAIVSGVRVTAIDEIAAERGLPREATRSTFLEYRPGRPALQRRDLGVQQVAETAPRWWPERHGDIARRRGDNDE